MATMKNNALDLFLFKGDRRFWHRDHWFRQVDQRFWSTRQKWSPSDQNRWSPSIRMG